ncbi:hypothetical protein ACIXR2_06100 [Bacteroides fragilis]
MFLQGNTFAPEKACPDGQSRRRRDFHTKGKRRGKKGDLPAAVLKRQPLLRLSPCSVALFFPALLSGLSFRFFGENNPLKQTVVAKVRACVALHNPAPGIVAPL